MKFKYQTKILFLNPHLVMCWKIILNIKLSKVIITNNSSFKVIPPPKFRKYIYIYIYVCAQLLQLCSTVYDPLPGSSNHGILQTRTLEPFSRDIYIYVYMYMCVYIYIYIYMINFVSWIQYWTIWYKWDYFLEIGDANSKEYAYQYRKPKRCGLIPGSGWAPGIGNGKPTPIFLPGKFHRQKNLAGSVHRVAKSRTQLGDWAQQSCFS